MSRRGDASEPQDLAEALQTITDLKAQQARLETELAQHRSIRLSSEENLARYAALYDLAPVANFTLDREGLILQSNLRAASLLGHSRVQLQKKAFDPFIDDAYLPVFHAFLQRVFASNDEESCEVTLTSFGQRPELVVQIDAIADPSGQTCSMVVIDITARREAEQASQHNYALLTNLSAQVPGILFQFRRDPNGHTSFPYIGGATNRMPGGTVVHTDMEVERLTECIHPDDLPSLIASREISATSLTPWRHEYRILLPDHGVFWRHLDAHPEILADGSILWHGYAIDITDRKRAEEALRLSEERWKFALEGAGDGVWDWDLTRNTVLYSKRWKEILGYEEADISDSPEEWQRRIHPEDIEKFAVEQKKLINQQISRASLDFRMVCKNGHWKWLQGSSLVVGRDGKGHPLRLVGTIRDITAQKKALEALRISEERWKFALEGASEGVWDWDIRTGITTYSKRWKEILGHSEDEISNHPDEWLKRIHPDYLPALTGAMQGQLDGTNPTSNLEFLMRCKNGEWKWIHGRGMVASYDNDGNALRIVGTISDISERKRFEEALRISEERWKFALEGAGDGVWDWDIKNNEILYSKRWKKIIGYEEHEISSRTEEWMDRIHPDDIPVARSNLSRLLLNEVEAIPTEVRMRHKNGQWIWILARGMIATRTSNGEALRVVGTISDITERKQIEEALRISEERWKFALEGSGDGVWDRNLETGEALYSRRWKEIMGYAEDETPANSADWFKRVHPEDMQRVIELFQSMGSSEQNTFAVELRMLCKDGNWKWVLIRGMAVSRNAEGIPLRVIGTNSDITERKRVEEQLRLNLIEIEQRRREAEILSEAKSRFLNAASHDLRQPLYATQLFADAIAGERLSTQQQETLDKLRLSIASMSAQLQMLLDVSRLDMGNIQPDPHLLAIQTIFGNLDATYTPIAKKAGVRLKFGNQNIQVHTDLILITRLLGNLIDNAIKFAPNGTILVCSRIDAKGIRIEVRDNGPGIPAEHRQKIFDEYYQVHNPARDPNAGLGLGLSIALRISRLLDIPLNLHSREGSGTAFSVTLPRCA